MATNDIYQRVTDKIVAELERGALPWLQPWSSKAPEKIISRPLRACGTPYSGINVLMLWGAALEKGYGSPFWMTYKQAQERGANVRKGEKSELVVYAGRATKTERNEATGDDEERSFSFLKSYCVFNAEQIDGLAPHYYAKAPAIGEAIETIEARNARVESFVAATGANVQHGGNRAFYAPAFDQIQMPPFAAFNDAESYYGTLLHELTHWTKEEKRCNRDFGRKRWGDEGYAAEELVAELGAAFLCADLGVVAEPRADHASYIASWLKVLKNDKRAIFTAASFASKAAEFLHGLQAPAEEPESIAAAELPLAA